MVFHVEIKSGVCQEYVPFPSRLQQKTKNVCLVTTLTHFVMESEPLNVKVVITLFKIPPICVTLEILDVAVVILVHLSIQAY